MASGGHQLAQLNVARLSAPLEDPRSAGFVSQLEAIYELAERAPGFVWRMNPADAQTPSRAHADPLQVVTLSVWESLEALREFVYRGAHGDQLRRRAEWFEPPPGHGLVLWWIVRGTLPRVEHGLARLKLLERHGPTPKAFTFAEPFPPPNTRA